MGLFSSKKSIPNKTCYDLFVNNIGLMYNFITVNQKGSFTKDSNEGKILYESFVYIMEKKQDQTLTNNNLKLNKEQKQIIKQAMIFVRDSLFETGSNETKNCVAEFGYLVTNKKDITKFPEYENFKKILSENDISFAD